MEQQQQQQQQEIQPPLFFNEGIVTLISADPQTFDNISILQQEFPVKIETNQCTFNHCQFHFDVRLRIDAINCSFRNCFIHNEGIDDTLINFQGSEFNDSTFRGDLYSSEIDSMSNFKNTVFNRCTFNERSNFYYSEFVDTRIDNSVIRTCDLSHINFTNARLNNVDFTSSSFKVSNLGSAILNNVNLTNVNLRGANLSGAQLINVDLTGAELSYTEEGEEQETDDETDSNLIDTIFYNVNLTATIIPSIIIDNTTQIMENCYFVYNNENYVIKNINRQIMNTLIQNEKIHSSLVPYIERVVSEREMNNEAALNYHNVLDKKLQIHELSSNLDYFIPQGEKGRIKKINDEFERRRLERIKKLGFMRKQHMQEKDKRENMKKTNVRQKNDRLNKVNASRMSRMSGTSLGGKKTKKLGKSRKPRKTRKSRKTRKTRKLNP
jgi:uncharacterized protein YjbI with pentapeptide repeats